MTTVDENVEFKRKLALINLERQNIGLNRANDNCDSIKKWLITIWFGTIGFAVNKDWKSNMLLSFLLLEILTFYFIDVQYRALIKAYKKKIEFMEEWLIKATNEEMLNLQVRLDSTFKPYSLHDRSVFIRTSITNKYTFPIYVFLMIVSIIISLLFFNVRFDTVKMKEKMSNS